MARKQEFDFDSFEVDGLDYDDPFGAGGQVKDDRAPATKVATGFLSGVKQTATSGSFLKNLVLGSLPKGYDTAAGTADSIISEGSGLYNEIVADTKPAVKELKRAVKSVSGAFDSVLPKKLSDRLKKFLEDEDSVRPGEEVDPNEAAIAAGLSGIFQQQEQAGKQQQASDVIRDAVAKKQHESEFAQLDSIRVGIQRLTNYQDSVTVQWQRKMLELSYRTFFANRDQLALAKGYSEESVTILRNIQKNTALPEAVKLKNSEIASQMLKERLIGKAQEWAGNGTRQFISDFFKNLRAVAKEKTAEFKDSVSAAASGIDSLQTVSELSEMSGVDKYQMGGDFAGSAVTNSLGNRLGKKLRGYLEKNPTLARYGEKAINLSENLPGYVRNWAKSDTDYNNPLSGPINFLKSVVPMRQGQNQIGYDTLANSKEKAEFSNHDSLSLTEIIPGYLARILQSSEGIRTGMDDVPLTVFDKSSNAFVSMKQLGQSIYKKAVSSYDLENINRRTGSLIDEIDPNKKLDPETRKAFQLELLGRADREDMFDPKEYADSYKYSANVNREQADMIASAIKEAFGIGDDGEVKQDLETAKLENRVARAFNDVKTVYPKLEELANMYANTGNRDVLRRMGLTKDRGGRDYVNEQFIFERYKEYANSGSDYQQSVMSAFPEDRGQAPTRQYGQIVMPDGYRPEPTPSPFRTPEPEPVVAQQPMDAQEDTWALHFNRVVEAINEQSAKQPSESAVITLNQILALITQIQQEGLRTSGEPGEPTEPGTGSVYDRIGKFGERMVGKAGRGLKGLWNFGTGIQRKAFDLSKSAFGVAKEFGSGLLGRAKSKIQDVYADGKVRLTAAGIVAGEYVDAVTKEPIKKLSDIKGAVLDKDGKIVLTFEQYKAGLYGIDGKKLITSTANWIGDKVGAFGGWAGSKVFGMMKTPKQLWDFAKKMSKKYLNRPVDVYVPGETKPRLTAIGLTNGEYISSKTYKPIYSLKDIDADVWDKYGNTRLTLEELAAGVVDVSGKPILSMTQRIIGLLKKAKDIGTGALGWLKDKAVGGLNTVKSLFGFGAGAIKGAFGGRGSGGDAHLQVESLNVLKMIYNLLKNNFGADGDDLVMTDLPSAAKSMFSSAKDKVKGWWDKRKQDKEEFVGPKQSMYQKAKGKFTDAKDRFTGKANDLKDQAADYWRGTADTRDSIKAQTEEVVDNIKRRIAELAKPSEDKTLSDGKDTVLTRFKGRAENARISLRELVKEKNNEDRSNSWMQQLKDRAERKKAAEGKGKDDDKKEPEKKEGILGKLLAVVMGLGGTLKGIWDKASGMFNWLGNIKDLLQTYLLGKAGADALGGADIDLPGGEGKKGRKGAGQMGPKQNLRSRLKTKALNAGQAIKNGAGAVGRGAMTAGRVALGVGGGLLGAASWAVRGAWALSGGALALLTSPVGLAGLAIAGAAYGGYKLYKYFKEKLSPLQKVRMAQYGVADDKEKYLKVGEFELALNKHLKMSGDGPVDIDDKVDFEKWMEFFGVNPQSADQRMSWAIWYGRRFKPVFLTNWTHLNRMAPGVKLEEVDDKMDDSLKVAFAKATRYADGAGSPYAVDASPFGGGTLPTGMGAVDAAIAEVVEEFGDVVGEVKSATITNQTVKGKRVSTLSVEGKQSNQLGKGPLATGASYQAPGKASGAPLLSMESNLKTGFGGGKSRTIDDLAAIRVGTYGLVGLDVGRVNTLLALEHDVIKSLSYLGEKASYEGDPSTLYATYASAFGGGDKDHQAVWMYWFKTRFIPVLLNFASAVRREDSSVNPADAFKFLTKRARFEVAKAIADTQTTSGGEGMSVWSIAVSPFAQAQANGDRNSIKSYLMSLENSIGKDDYLESPRVKLSTDIKLTKPIPYRDSKVASKPGSSVGQTPFGAPIVHRANINNPTLEGGAGEGGLYKEVPKPTGDGTYGAFKDTLAHVAKMVGIDPAMLATIARIESSFKSKAKAATSSASGLFQFLASTWREMMDKYGAKYGIPLNARPTDPVAASILGAEFIKQNQTHLESKLGRAIGATDAYLAHFMGAGGATKMLKADTNALGSSVFPKEAKSNQAIFYNKDGSPRTIGEIYQVFDKKVTSGGSFEPKEQDEPTGVETLGTAASAPANGDMVDLTKYVPKSNASNAATTPPAEKSVTSGGGMTTEKPKTEQPKQERIVTNRSAMDAAVNDPTTSIAEEQRKAVEDRRKFDMEKKRREAAQAEMGAINQLLTESLLVQKTSSEYLRDIHAHLISGKTDKAPAAPVAAKPSQLSPPPVNPVSAARSRPSGT